MTGAWLMALSPALEDGPLVPRLALPDTWDEETDVVVIGCGYAGAVAALSALDAGARVTLIEKMREPGGISVCSAGGVRVADDADAAFAYLRETNGATAPDAVLRTLASGMTEVEEFVRALGRETGAVSSRRARIERERPPVSTCTPRTAPAASA